RIDRQIERKPFSATPTRPTGRAIDRGFFALLIELLLLIPIARLDKTNRRGLEFALPYAFVRNLRQLLFPGVRGVEVPVDFVTSSMQSIERNDIDLPHLIVRVASRSLEVAGLARHRFQPLGHCPVAD